MLAVYFANWSIYARGYTCDKLPFDAIDTIIYAFFKTDPATGVVSLSDPWADTDKPQPLGGQGCLGELGILKQKHKFRVLLSIGGWTYSSDLTQVFSDPAKVDTFAKSAVKLCVDHSLDGIDIDWEYPETPEQAAQYVSVLQRVRLELASAEMRANMPRGYYKLTIAAPAGNQRTVLNIKEMDRYLDHWNIMSYDFSGSWSPAVGHQAALFGPLSASTAIQFYLGAGVASTKIIMGMPLYGRSFDNTEGYGHPFRGVLPGKYEAGTHDFKELPLAGHKEHVDKKACAAYCQSKDQFVSYDNKDTMKQKAKWAKSINLGGGMWWEASGDREGRDSLIRAFAKYFS